MIIRVTRDGEGSLKPALHGHGAGDSLLYGVMGGNGRGSPTNIHGDGNGYNRFVYDGWLKPQLPGERL